MGELKILGRITSINVRKVVWAADEIGLDYIREDWGMPGRDPKVPEFLALNPNGQVPVMIRDGFVLWESNAIMRHLAETSRSDLWPAAPKERALVDQWLTWQVAELNPQWGYAVNALMRKNPAFNDAARIKASIDGWTRAMEILDAQLSKSGGAFVVNGRMSLADIAIALSTHRWMSTPFERKTLPAVAAHYAAMQERIGGKYLTAETP